MGRWLKKCGLGWTAMAGAALLVAFLVGCDSKGGSGKSNNGAPIEKPEGPGGSQIRLQGWVQGLKGVVILANGSESRTLTTNGPFTFVSQVSEGQSYDVKISSLPNGQVCELNNSRGRAEKGMAVILVDCADMIEVNINVAIPQGYNFADLTLRSNFEQIQLSEGSELKSGFVSTKIYAFNNTFVSLTDSQNQVLYTVYIPTVESSYTLDASSTALSLLVLEPSLALAIRDRAGGSDTGSQTSTAVLTAFLNAMVDLQYTKDLSGAISAFVDSGGHLSAISEEIAQLFAKLHRRVLTEIVEGLPLAVGSPHDRSTKIVTTTPAGSKIFLEAGSDSGSVSFDHGDIVEGTPATIAISNHDNRFVIVHPQDTSSSEALAPGDSYAVQLANGLGSQQSFQAEIFGPGAKGELNDNNAVSVAEATAVSSVDQYFLPSLSLLMGLKKPLEFDVKECLSATTIQSLETHVIDSFDLFDLFRTQQYHRVYSLMAQLAGEAFSESGENSMLAELLACDKFGIGVFVEKNKVVTKENIRSILKVVGPLYANASMSDDSTDLFTLKDASFLAKAIQGNFSYRLWKISNRLALSLSLKNAPISLYEGGKIEFIGACYNPVDKAPVACDIHWIFGDQSTADGIVVSNTYMNPGSYTVIAEAVDSAGARIENTISLNILAKAPAIKIADFYERTLLNDKLGYDFGLVKVGDNKSVEFTVSDIGTDDLVISGISSSNSTFSIAPDYQTVLKPFDTDPLNNSTKLKLTFSPKSEEMQQGNVVVVSNDPANTSFSFGLRGEGVLLPELPSDSQVGGVWTVFDVDDANTTIFSAVRVTSTYIEDKKQLSIRAFSNINSDFPQLDLQIIGYDLSGSSNGKGTYLLDDQGSDLCLGFFALSESEESKQFCSSSAGANGKNDSRVTITASDIDGKRRALFHFYGVSREFCSSEQGSCGSIEVTGELKFND